MNEQFDVAVIGSGPGGSVVSTILAQKGYRVVVIERERHTPDVRARMLGVGVDARLAQVDRASRLEVEVQLHGFSVREGEKEREDSNLQPPLGATERCSTYGGDPLGYVPTKQSYQPAVPSALTSPPDS